MGIVIKKTIPSLHLTHKDYKLNERMLKFLCRFPKERRERNFFRIFQGYLFQIFLVFFSLFFYFSLPKSFYFLQKIGEGGVIYRDAKKIGGYVMVFWYTSTQPPTSTPKQSISSFSQFLFQSSCDCLEAFPSSSFSKLYIPGSSRCLVSIGFDFVIDGGLNKVQFIHGSCP